MEARKKNCTYTLIIQNGFPLVPRNYYKKFIRDIFSDSYESLSRELIKWRDKARWCQNIVIIVTIYTSAFLINRKLKYNMENTINI